MMQLRAIKQNEFQEAFQTLKKRWKPTVASGGDYFERENGKNDVNYLINLFYSQFGPFLNTPCMLELNIEMTYTLNCMLS